MKRLILTILTFVSSLNFIAQTDPFVGICVNQVSTDWQNPTNNNLPLDANGNPDQRFLNSFDWVNGDLNNGAYIADNMFFSANDPVGNMLNVKPAIAPIDYYDYLFGGDRFSPKNGWELLLFNLGRYPDNITTHSYENLKFSPYIVLYNRYTGIIRVFVAYGKNEPPNLAIDGVKIDLEFEKNSSDEVISSGLMRLNQGKDVALDKVTQVTKMTAVAKNPGLENKWYSADFQIAYDPCTCIYPSRLKLNFSFFSETDFRLVGNALSQNDIDMTNAQELLEQDFLGSFELDEDGNPENGYIIYKNLGSAIDDYIEQLEDYKQELASVQIENSRIKRNLAIANAFKNIVLSGINPVYITSQVVSVLAASSDGETWATDFIDHAEPLLDNGNLKLKVLKKETQEILGEQFDFFIDRAFKEKDSPSPPSAPSVSYTQMSFDGEMSNDLDISGVDFMAPGTFDNSEYYPIDPNTLNTPLVYKYPIYNEVLGQFALLKTPKVELYSELSDESCLVDVEDDFQGDWLTYYELEFISKTQWKLGEKLKYTLNPALNKDNFQIRAAIELIGKQKQLEFNPFQTLQLSDEVTDKTIVNASSTSLEFENGLQNTQPLIDSIKVISEYVPIDALENLTSQMKYKIIRNQLEIGQDQLNGFCEDYLSGFELSQANLKLIIDVTYEGNKENGSPHEYTYMYTYKMDINEVVNPIVPNLPGSSGDITQYPENLFLNGENFDGSPVEGCELNGNTYTCKAWNNITVEGDFTVASGYFVDVEAGNEIDIVAESNTPDEMHFSIVPVLDFSDPMPPQDATAVAAFCNDNNAYQANTSVKSGKTVDNNEGSTKSLGIENTASDFNFALYPNPTSGQTNASIVLENDAKASLIVTDLSGKKLIHKLNNELLNEGENRLILDSHSLAPGIYLVHLSVNGKKYVKRLVKQ